MRRINNEDVSLKKKRDKRKIIHTILSILVILVMVRQFFMENYANVFTCVLTLILFMIPSPRLSRNLPFPTLNGI